METFTWKKHSTDLLKNMGDFYRFKLNLDCSFLVEGRYLGGHKLILSAASPYFEELFLNHSGKKSITLKHIKYNDFKSVLDFIYFGIVKIPLKHVESFIEAATTLQVPVPHGKCNEVKISSVSGIEGNRQIIDNKQDNASSISSCDESKTLLYDDMTEKLRAISLSERILRTGIEDLKSIQSDVSYTPNMEEKSENEVMNNSDPHRISIDSYYSCITSMQEKREEDRRNECETSLKRGFEATETFCNYSDVDKGLLKVVEETNEVCQQTIEDGSEEMDMAVANESTGKGTIDSLRKEANNYGWALSQLSYEADPSTSKENQSYFSNQKLRPIAGGGFQEQTLKAGGDCKENEPSDDNGQMFIPSDYLSFNNRITWKADSGFHLKENEPNEVSASVSSIKLRQIKKEKIKKAQTENQDLKICLCEYLPLVSSSHFIIVKHHKRSYRKSHKDKRKKSEKQRKRDKETRSAKRGSKQHCHSSKLHREGSSPKCESQGKQRQKSSKRKQPEEGAEAADDPNARANTLSRGKSLKVEERVPESSRVRDERDSDAFPGVSSSPSKMPSTYQEYLESESAACTRVVTFPVAGEVESPEYLVQFPSSEDSGTETAAPMGSFSSMEVSSANPFGGDQDLDQVHAAAATAAPVPETLFHVGPATTSEIVSSDLSQMLSSDPDRGSTTQRRVVFNPTPTRTFERSRSFCVVSRLSNKQRQVVLGDPASGRAGRDLISRGKYAKTPSSTGSSRSESRSRSRSASRVGGCTRIIIQEFHESDTYRLGRVCDERKKPGGDDAKLGGEEKERRRMMKRTVSSSSSRSVGATMWEKDEEQRWKRQEEERRKREEELRCQREEERKRQSKLHRKQDEERKRMEEQRNWREEEERRRHIRYERERLREEEALQKRLEKVRRARFPKHEDRSAEDGLLPRGATGKRRTTEGSCSTVCKL